MKCNKDDNMFKPGDKVFVRHHTQDEKEISTCMGAWNESI